MLFCADRKTPDFHETKEDTHEFRQKHDLHNICMVLFYPQTKYLQNRSVIPHNRKGATAFAVFLLSLFVSGQDKPASGVRCRSPPVSLNFHSKNSDWR